MLGRSAQEDRIADSFAGFDGHAGVALLFCESEHFQIGQRFIDHHGFEPTDSVHRDFFAQSQVASHGLFDVVDLGDGLSIESLEPFEEIDHVVFVFAGFIEVQRIRELFGRERSRSDPIDLDDASYVGIEFLARELDFQMG